jgi:hypothetical protein
MTSKEIQIMVTACLKSLIESGVPSDQWEDKTLAACRTIMTTANKIESAMSRPRPETAPGQNGHMVRRF